MTTGRQRLVRPEDDRMIAGVCSGVALAFGIDRTLVRVLTAVLAAVFFPVVPLVYLVLAVVVPSGARIRSEAGDV